MLAQSNRQTFHLNVRGVQHDTAGGTKSARRQGDGELGADSSTVSVRTGNLAPDALDLGVITSLGFGGSLVRLGAVHIGNTLSAVESGVGGVVDRVDLQEGSGGVLRTLAALVAKVACLNVQSKRMDGLVCGGWIM